MFMDPSLALVLGRGEVYFDRFRPGTRLGEGERYLGNTTSFGIGTETETVVRKRSYGGRLVALDPLPIEEKITGALTTDHIDMENVSLWFGGAAVEEDVQPAIGLIEENFVVMPKRFYQLGSSFTVQGVRYVTHARFRVAGNVVPLSGNFVLDADRGRFSLADNAPNVQPGQTVTVEFEWRRSQEASRTVNASQPLMGALRFIGTNPYGQRKDVFLPCVTLKASGEFSLKGDEWQQVAFTLEACKLSPRHKLIYITAIATAGLTRDEQAIIGLGGVTFAQFQFFEDQLNTLTNVILPADLR